MDLQWWMQCYAFDVIAAISVAKRFGFLDAMADPFSLIATVDGWLEYVAHVGIYSELHRLLFRLTKLIAPRGSARVMDFAVKQVRERLESQTPTEKRIEGRDFLARLLLLHDEEPQKVSLLDVTTVIWGNVAAGSDTTSITLTGILWNLFKNPRVLENVSLLVGFIPFSRSFYTAPAPSIYSFNVFRSLCRTGANSCGLDLDSSEPRLTKSTTRANYRTQLHFLRRKSCHICRRW